MNKEKAKKKTKQNNSHSPQNPEMTIVVSANFKLLIKLFIIIYYYYSIFYKMTCQSFKLIYNSCRISLL